MRKRGFTMTELMVALAIVAVLAGIGTPLAIGMMRRARQSACLTNLAGIGGALDVFLRDNGGRLPVMEAGRRSRKNEVAVLDTVLMGYVQGERVFCCPEGVKEFHKTGCSYFWNPALSGSTVREASFMGMRNSPESIPLVTDKESWHPEGVNILYADGSATHRIRFATEKRGNGEGRE